jgi:hypothetical protein
MSGISCENRNKNLLLHVRIDVLRQVGERRIRLNGRGSTGNKRIVRSRRIVVFQPVEHHVSSSPGNQKTKNGRVNEKSKKLKAGNEDELTTKQRDNLNGEKVYGSKRAGNSKISSCVQNVNSFQKTNLNSIQIHLLSF